MPAMPTPVNTARQCLTPEAATALDEAVSVAKRRSHSQTTSLHAVSALLSLPSSALRDACSRSRNAAYPPGLQFKALELCLSVSLDRVPSSGQLVDDPPISNSLMAAIKRSQASQRRQPENFHLYHQMAAQCSSSSSSSSSSSMSPSSINNLIKVELQHLILSILDDPVVSRVFGEAGFRSTEIKLALARPLPHLFRYGRPSGVPPLLLPEGLGLGGRRGLGFNFPFSVFPEFSDVDENFKKIGELLVRNKGRNPLLVGMYAIGALRSFIEIVKSMKEGCLPTELSGLSVVSIEDDLSKLVAEEKIDEARLDSVFGEVSDTLRQCSGAGLLVNFGDLKGFVCDQANREIVSLVIARLAKLLEEYSGKVWCIGVATSYDTYLKFLSRHPSAEKELDLQILPITTLRPSRAESGPRSSLMESFVPLAGFFSASSELSIPVSGNSYQCVPPHDVHGEKKKEETIHVTRGVSMSSVTDQYQCSLPSWLRMAELGTKAVSAKNKDDGLSATACALQMELQYATESRLNESNRSLIKTDSCLYGTESRIVSSSMSTESQKAMTSQHVIEAPNVPKTKESLLSKHAETTSNVEHIDSSAFRSPHLSGSNSNTNDGSQISPVSATSVPTSLGLGAAYAFESVDLNVRGNQTACLSPRGSNSFKEIIPGNLQQPSCGLSSDINVMDFKMLYGDIIKKLGRQAEAVRSICEALCRARSKTRKAASRADLWFTFLGGDKFGKRRIAVALTEILHKHLIFVDLCPQGGIRHDDVIFSKKVESYDGKYRGKTTVDVIAGELGKNPCSIIFLENIEKADEQVQSNLSQALWSGKFSDSYGREVSMRNAVVIAASNLVRVGGVLSSVEESGQYAEDRVLGSKCWQIKLLVECSIREDVVDNHSPVPCMSKTLVNKRKLHGENENVVLLETSESVKRANRNSCGGLDLNLPAEGEEILHGDDGGSPDDSDAISDDTTRWLSEFLDRMDGTASFKPYDLDTLASNIFKGIKNSFSELLGSGYSLVVYSKVMDQLVLAAYVSDGKNTWEEWLKQVLNREFTEVRNRFPLSSGSVVVKLMTSDSPLWEDQAFCGHLYLPSRIIVNSS